MLPSPNQNKPTGINIWAIAFATTLLTFEGNSQSHIV